MKEQRLKLLPGVCVGGTRGCQRFLCLQQFGGESAIQGMGEGLQGLGVARDGAHGSYRYPSTCTQSCLVLPPAPIPFPPDLRSSHPSPHQTFLYPVKAWLGITSLPDQGPASSRVSRGGADKAKVGYNPCSRHPISIPLLHPCFHIILPPPGPCFLHQHDASPSPWIPASSPALQPFLPSKSLLPVPTMPTPWGSQLIATTGASRCPSCGSGPQSQSLA